MPYIFTSKKNRVALGFPKNKSIFSVGTKKEAVHMEKANKGMIKRFVR